MQRLPGFRDFYPEPLPASDVWSADARQYIFDKWRAMGRRYGFREYDGPPLEPLELFTVKSGEEIVGQLYNFVDKGDRAVALRPEMTPTLARMARRALDAGRRRGDPRFLGQVQAALAPWWNDNEVPASALLLRATLKQAQHDFTGSLADLVALARTRVIAGAIVGRALYEGKIALPEALDAVASC